MTVRIGINGFGRIGRLLTRVLLGGQTGLQLVMVNARADNETLAHLLKYDSVHGIFPHKVEATEDGFQVEGQEVKVSRAQVGEWQWQEAGVDIVVETTGSLKNREGLARHLDCGVQKVVVGAPAKDADLTVVMGVNHDLYDPKKHVVLSNASCTTNCMAPATKVIHDNWGIKHALMTTIHSFTMSQRILDGSHKDLRRARAASMSIIPTTTGAAKAVTMVIPELQGKLHGMAMRVPTPNVSLVDMVCELEKPATAQDVNTALQAAANGPMQSFMGYSEKPLVSVDYTSSTYGGVVDGLLTTVLDDTQLKVIIWYDNESGYTHQLLRFLQYIAAKL